MSRKSGDDIHNLQFNYKLGIWYSLKLTGTFSNCDNSDGINWSLRSCENGNVDKLE